MKSSIHILCFVLFLIVIGLNFSFSQSKYHSYDELTKEITSIVSSNKNIASVSSLSKTPDKHDLWCVTVGGKDADKRHAMLIVGGVEGDRLIGSELTLGFLNFLLKNYGKIDSITQLVNTTTFYILPRVNPDASEQFFRKPLYNRTVNGNPTDDDRDGLIDEDSFEDLNSDGIISMMRVKDSRGEWMPHPDDPRIMKKADASKGEVGIYKLYTEGIDNDGDEIWNEDDLGGVDFNRNFPHNYQFFSKGAGPYQISEPETRAVAEFCFAHPNIAIVFAFSSNDNLLNTWKKEQRQGPPQQQDQRSGRRRMSDDEDFAPRILTSVMDDDEQYYNFIGKQYQELTKFKGVPASSKGEGAFNEWAYYHFGRWSFAANPWWIPEIEIKKDSALSDTTKKQPDRKNRSMEKPENKFGKPGEEKSDEYADQIKALKWIDANGIKDGFLNWTKIKHKDFPDNEVEVGGFKPFILTNPPADSIDVIAAKENSFLAWLAGRLPKVDIANVKVEPVNGKVFRLTAEIANTGYFPTNSAMGNKARWGRNVKVTLGINKNQKISSGKPFTIIEPVKGSGGIQELVWTIISGPGETVIISAESPAVGIASKTVTLK